MDRKPSPDESGDAVLWNANSLVAPHAQSDKASRVRAMFDTIAPTYERINSVFSAGRDTAWRRRAVALADFRADDRLLDIACGTGDFARMFSNQPGAPELIVGCDFAGNMLSLAAAREARRIRWVQADALELPFPDESFTLVSCAFGVRNFQDLDLGLREMHRVLTDGGRAVILEFRRPSNPVFRKAYEWYASRLMPVGAALVSGDRTGAYRYLPSSVVSFLDPDAMQQRLFDAGFSAVSATAMTFGVVAIYVADKHGRKDATTGRG